MRKEPMTGHMWTQEGNNGDEAVGLFREHGCLKDGAPSDESAYRQGWKLVPVVESPALIDAVKGPMRDGAKTGTPIAYIHQSQIDRLNKEGNHVGLTTALFNVPESKGKKFVPLYLGPDQETLAEALKVAGEALDRVMPEWYSEELDGGHPDLQAAAEISWGDVRAVRSAINRLKTIQGK